MKKFLALLTTFILALNIAGHTAFAEGKDTELDGKMKIIAKSMKQLKGQIADATKQKSSIELVEAAKKAAEEGSKLIPAKAADVPEADRPKFITDYQAQMGLLIKDLDALDAALKDGKYDDAQKIYATLGQVKRDGHQKFTKQD